MENTTTENNNINNTVKKSRKLKFFVIFLAFIAVAELSSFILLSRLNSMGFWPQQPFFHPYLGWKPPANATLRLSSHAAYWEILNYHNIKTNEFRRPETPIIDDPEMHVAITGGGPLMGVGTPDNEHSIPSLVGKLIHENLGIKAQVHNLAIGGYNSFQEMLNLLDYIKENPLDLAVSVTGLNDYINGLNEPHMRSTGLVDSVYQRAEVINNGMSLLSYIRTKSYAVEVMMSVLPPAYTRLHDYLSIQFGSTFTLMKEDPPPSDEMYKNINERVRITSLHFSMMELITKEYNTDFAVFLMPQTFTKKNLSEVEVKVSESWVNEEGRVSTDNLKLYGVKYYDRLNEVEKSYPFYDITDIFDNTNETRYVDLFTFNGVGAEGVARAIFERIKPILLKRKQEKTQS
ncbi:MAG: hypothetical protein HQL69_09905 [Magnetococcales bacterium]|nr:hypothetical protein [Magnetococcales bacterium]